MELPKRKHPRLKDYDYSQNGCYFVTVCTKGRQRLLSSIAVGRHDHMPPQVQLTRIGEVAEKYIGSLEQAYEGISLDAYVIMPDHVHLLVRMHHGENGGMWSSRPTLQQVIRSFKTMVTKEIGHSVWQASFYEHVIRSEEDWRDIANYIEENPQKWLLTHRPTP